MSEKVLIDVDEKASPGIIKLLALGRKKKFVTFDDILNFFPNAEQDVALLEEAFAALLSAGVPFIEDATLPGPSDDELESASSEVEDKEKIDQNVSEDYLANIDTKDTIGLYLKEVSRVPLLTAEQEVSLAQRIERGRNAREELAQGRVTMKRRTELRRLIEDGWAAREHLITANSRLVISVAKKIYGARCAFS